MSHVVATKGCRCKRRRRAALLALACSALPLVAAAGTNDLRGSKAPAAPHSAAPHSAPPVRSSVAHGSSPAAHPAEGERPELALQLGHSMQVQALAFSPDGRLLASGAEDGTIKLWNPRTHDLIRTLAGHGAAVTSVAFSPDGLRVLSGSKDGTARIWHVSSGKTLLILNCPGERVLSVAYAPDGKTVATAATAKPGRPAIVNGKPVAPDGHITFWSSLTGERGRVATVTGAGVNAIAFAPDGAVLAGGCDDRLVRLWDAADGGLKESRKTGLQRVLAVAYAPKSQLLAAGGVPAPGHSAIVLWNADGTLRPGQLAAQGTVRALSFTSDAADLISASSQIAKGWLECWDLQKNQSVRRWGDQAGPIFGLACSPDGPGIAPFIASGAVRKVALWSAGGTGEGELEGRNRNVQAIAYSPDGKTLASCGTQKSVQLWDAASGTLKATLTAPPPGLPSGGWCLAFSPNGKLLALGGEFTHGVRDIHVWDTATGQLRMTVPGHLDTTYALAFSPDGKVLASGSDKPNNAGHTEEVKLWNTSTGALIRTMWGEEGWVKSLTFSPDGHWLASSNEGQVGQGHVTIWNAATGEQVRVLRGQQGWATSVAFAHRGAWVASGSWDGSIRVWETATGKLLRTIRADAAGVNSVAIGADQTTVICGGRTGTVSAWNLATGARLYVAKGHEFNVLSVAVAPDGSRFATGSWDTTVRVWDAHAGRELAKLLTAPAEETEDAKGGDAWLAVTPEGYYHCSEGADYLFKWRFRSQLVPFYKFEETYRRPDIVRRALHGERIAERPLTINRIPPVCWILKPDPEEAVERDAIRVLVEATDDTPPTDVQMYANGILVPELVAKPIRADAKAISAYAKAISADAKPINADAKPISADSKPITVDGKEVPSEHAFSRVFTVDVPLPPGEKTVLLRAVVYDDEKNKCDAAVTIHRAKAMPAAKDLYVLCVGVSRYRNPTYNLTYAASDAGAIEQALQPQAGREYAHVHATLLTDTKASSKGIMAAVQDLQKKAKPGDTVLVFLSGHGVQRAGKFYFAPWGIVVNDVENTCLAWQSLVGALAQVYARKLLFTDACHSGAKLGPYQATSEQLAEAARKRSGIVMMASSRGDEFSFEDRELKRGAFTQALLEAFGGKADFDGDNEITLPEIALYVPRRVTDLTKGLQNPQLVLVQDINPQAAVVRSGKEVLHASVVP